MGGSASAQTLPSLEMTKIDDGMHYLWVKMLYPATGYPAAIISPLPAQLAPGRGIYQPEDCKQHIIMRCTRPVYAYLRNEDGILLL